jgi:signal transduction histidine kinase
MKLRERFFLSHGGMVVLTLAIGFALIHEGGRLLYQRQARLSQQQQVNDFAMTAKESLAQREDVAVLNFMKSAVRNPLVVFTAYSNFSTGTRVVYPQALERQAGGAVSSSRGQAVGLSPPNRSLLLPNGSEILEWSSPVSLEGRAQGEVRLGYSRAALEKDLGEQMDKLTRLELEAGGAALFVGMLVSLLLGRQMAKPLGKISEGTHQVRAGKLDSLVEVSRKDEIGDLARDFNSMVLQLKELDEMKRDFVAGVTHDLGTPLQAIRSAINYLQAGDAGPLTEKQSEYLLMVSNSTASLSAFINNLLTTARIEAGKVEPHFEPVDVFTHVKELVDLYQPQAREKGVKLSLVKKAHYISLVADVTMFRQIVLNLLSNALKFTPRGEVDVLLSEENGDLVLEVRDTGIGIDPSHHQLVFEKFYRVHQPAGSPARQGSGLGLTIVKGLVDAHGGHITLESALGKGSSFRVAIPKQPWRP